LRIRTLPATGRRTGESGFTLFEMIVVLVVLGLVLAMVAGRSTAHSRTLDLKATAEEMAAGLRLTRSVAIREDRPASFRVDPATGQWQAAGGRQRALPPDVVVAVQDMPGNTVRFDPDGGASGGRIDLRAGARTVAVAVNWLTGRVSIADAP
jgi:general secretion pathway protein H